MELKAIIALAQIGELEGYEACGVFRGIEFAIDAGVFRLPVWGW